MGISTDGQICFGVLFEEGYEFPWDCEEYAYDIYIWWDKIAESGSLPAIPVNYCSCDYPMYILAIPKTLFIANRGYPVKFNPKELEVSQDEVNNLLDFCKKYGLEFIDGPAWFLSSNWC